MINGTEKERNKHADRIINKLLNECVWINIHMLSHEGPILEVYSASYFILTSAGLYKVMAQDGA